MILKVLTAIVAIGLMTAAVPAFLLGVYLFMEFDLSASIDWKILRLIYAALVLPMTALYFAVEEEPKP